MVLQLLQRKYCQANRHFLWSDDFCKLVEQHSARIRSDPTNKYVHIRGMVSELKAYKAKPMKQVIPSTHSAGLDSDDSLAGGDCPAVKRAKVERFVSKQELAGVMEEESVGTSKLNDASLGLPELVRHASSLCQFVPLSAMRRSESVDLGSCRLVDVSVDDADSRSSSDDGCSFLPVTEATGSVVTDDVSNSTGVVTASMDSAVNCGKRLFDSTEGDNLLKPSSTCVQHSEDPREMAKVTEMKVQTKSDRSQLVPHCSTEQRDTSEAQSKLASDRHIKYLESLLSV